MNRPLPFACPLSAQTILRYRASILTDAMMRDEGFSCVPVRGIRPETLRFLYERYDALFFGGLLSASYREMELSVSGRLLSSAGKFLCERTLFGKRKAEIRMSGDFLTRLDKGPFRLNGLCVSTPQEAFLIVFEHELCHAAETALFGGSGHSSRLMMLAGGLFGHTDYRHSLPTRRQEAAESGLLPGSTVSFLYGNSLLTGIVTYVGKSLTVMVRDPRGQYHDRRGYAYTKYRVDPKAVQVRGRF